MPVVERMRAQLGTFVTIRAETDGGEQGVAERAVRSAFAAIRKVERLMSFHRPGSDVSRINRAPVGKVVRVHPWTAEVLREAHRLWEESGGAFDCDVGAVLVRRRLLPTRRGRSLALRPRARATAAF